MAGARTPLVFAKRRLVRQEPVLVSMGPPPPPFGHTWTEMAELPMNLARTVAAAMVLRAVVACGGDPDIPHPTDSTQDDYCRKCHTGRAGAPDSGHNGRSDCTSCHAVTETGPFPGPMPHPLGDESRCVLCHVDGTAGAPRASHIEEQDCRTCHISAQAGSWPPVVSHQVTSPDDASCLSCHGNIDHRERPSCLSCHKG